MFAASKQQLDCCRCLCNSCFSVTWVQYVAHLLCHAQECEAILHQDMEQVMLLGKCHLSAGTDIEPRKPLRVALGAGLLMQHYTGTVGCPGSSMSVRAFWFNMGASRVLFGVLLV